MPPSPATRPPSPDANIVPTAALLADPARVAMLWALIDGRALPAGELASAAGVRPSTASSHIAKLTQAGWVRGEARGRNRYLRLANPDVAGLLEALAVVGGTPLASAGPLRHVSGELRLARSCYDHLAGQAGVGLTEALVIEGAIEEEGRGYRVTSSGRDRLARLGIDTGAIETTAKLGKRYFTRTCLDWSERRHHLAGALGQALLALVLERGWFERRRGTRALRLTNAGRRSLYHEFGVRLV